MDAPAQDPPRAPVQVLLVEARPALRQLLADLLQADPQLRVAAALAEPRAAVEFLQQGRADVLLLDHDGPGTAALDGIRRIMETRPLPIVLCTADDCVGATVFGSLEAGAVACISKPDPGDAATQAQRVAHMRQTLKLMSEVKVVRHWTRMPSIGRTGAAPSIRRPGNGRIQVIGIGASTGGPPALQTILAGLPSDLAVPVLVVQHIAAGFLPGMAQWLWQTTGLQVEIGAHGVAPQPGHVYLAPDGLQMGITRAGRLVTSAGADDGGLRPSVAFLFHTLAEVYGPQAVGVLLSGMGKDGAAELKQMRERGAVTIAQDSETSVVHGMPGEAIALGGASHVLPTGKIAGALRALLRPDRCEGS